MLPSVFSIQSLALSFCSSTLNIRPEKGGRLAERAVTVRLEGLIPCLPQRVVQGINTGRVMGLIPLVKQGINTGRVRASVVGSLLTPCLLKSGVASASRVALWVRVSPLGGCIVLHRLLRQLVVAFVFCALN